MFRRNFMPLHSYTLRMLTAGTPENSGYVYPELLGVASQKSVIFSYRHKNLISHKIHGGFNLTDIHRSIKMFLHILKQTQMKHKDIIHTKKKTDI
jgi:hypothetical protein